jgi:hypothetical protein
MQGPNVYMKRLSVEKRAFGESPQDPLFDLNVLEA